MPSEPKMTPGRVRTRSAPLSEDILSSLYYFFLAKIITSVIEKFTETAFTVGGYNANREHRI